MVMHVKFDSLADLEALQKLANAADAPVYLSSEDESLQVDARTFLGLFSVDFSKPVKVVTDSLYVIRRLPPRRPGHVTRPGGTPFSGRKGRRQTAGTSRPPFGGRFFIRPQHVAITQILDGQNCRKR